MKSEYAINFAEYEVRAALEGRKTQARRIVKPVQSTPRIPPLTMTAWLFDGAQEEDEDGRPYWTGLHPEYPTTRKWFTCPFGKVGTRLWVQETWSLQIPVGASIHADRIPRYRADEGEAAPRWIASTQMPRWASRLTFEIVNVRVERVQDITEEDARAEGIPANWIGDLKFGAGTYKNKGWDPDTDGYLPARWEKADPDDEGFGLWAAREAFATWWDAVNGKGAWERNNWVWVLELKRVEEKS